VLTVFQAGGGAAAMDWAGAETEGAWSGSMTEPELV
jgi:hypothetical protein